MEEKQTILHFLTSVLGCSAETLPKSMEALWRGTAVHSPAEERHAAELQNLWFVALVAVVALHEHCMHLSLPKF